MDHFLALNAGRDKSTVVVHVDKKGIDFLIEKLLWLRRQLETCEGEHDHLFAPPDGKELAYAKLDEGHSEEWQVYHLEIIGWTEKWLETIKSVGT